MMDDESHIKRIHNYDMAVLVIGFNDIKKGGNGISVGKKLINCVTKIKDLELDVAILELPPAGISSTDSDLFNMKIEGMEGVEILKISQDVDIMTQDQIFDKERTLKCDILAIMTKAINEQVSFPEKKMKTTLKALEPTEISETNRQNDKEEDDLMMKETFTIDKHYTGLIIGKSGTMIKTMTGESGIEVRITDAEICGDIL